MFATIIAILISLYIFTFGRNLPSDVILPYSLIAAAFLLAFGIGALLVSFLPIQKAEQNFTPRLSELFRKDLRINLELAFLFCLPLLVFASSFTPFSLILALLLIAIGIDIFYLLLRRIMDYLNPFRSVDFLEQEALYAIDQSNDPGLCNIIESCSEVAIKALQRHNSALTNHTFDALEKMGEVFLASSKRLSRPVQNLELKAEGIEDSLSYVLVFLLQHLESIHEHALDKKLELVAGHVITTLTKLAIYTTRIDLSLTALPLYYVDKLSMHAMKKGFQDVGVKATLGLLSVADAISKRNDLQYMDLKPSFITIITTLDAIGKETFSLDKTTKIPILTQPFRQLAKLIEKEPLRNHQDKEVIRDQLTRVLAEYEALETVMTTMPPMPPIFPEEEAKRTDSRGPTQEGNL